MHNFFFLIALFMRQCGKKYGIAGQTTDDNMAHTLFMLYTSGYKHTLIICNANCFSTAAMIMRIRLNVTLYVHCQSCQSRILQQCFRYCDPRKTAASLEVSKATKFPRSPSRSTLLLTHLQFSPWSFCEPK